MGEITVSIEQPRLSYNIFIGKGVSGLAFDFVKSLHCSRHAVITDSNVKEGAAAFISEAVNKLGALVISFRAGEGSKNLDTVRMVYDKMLKMGCGRDTALIAVGGGVVGDVGGFVAATFSRGIPYIHVPTTLLAMVDSSIGGKVGVDTKHGKNLIGTFYQPAAVYSDADFLKTLPQKELSNGLAEVIKMAATFDHAFFGYVEANIGKALAKDTGVLSEMVRKSCLLKKAVVEADEKESSGKRMLLNFGHTVGHAIEKLSGYKMPHGEAVAVGMAVEAEISRLKELLGSRDVERLKALITAARLPTSLPGYSFSRLLDAMRSDKKAKAGQLRFVLLKGMGRFVSSGGNYAFEAEENIVREAVEKCRGRKI